LNSVADPHNVDADPDPACHFTCNAEADLDTTFHFDAVPDPDPVSSFLKNCSNRLNFHTFYIRILSFNLMPDICGSGSTTLGG
jgi:hypothetical protein